MSLNVMLCFQVTLVCTCPATGPCQLTVALIRHCGQLCYSDSWSFPSLNSPTVVGLLDVQELKVLCSHTPSLGLHRGCREPNLLPPGHRNSTPAQSRMHPPWGNLTTGSLFGKTKVLTPTVPMKGTSKETGGCLQGSSGWTDYV